MARVDVAQLHERLTQWTGTDVTAEQLEHIVWALAVSNDDGLVKQFDRCVKAVRRDYVEEMLFNEITGKQCCGYCDGPEDPTCKCEVTDGKCSSHGPVKAF